MATTAALPLTTTFSPPADCTTDSYHVLRSASSNYSWWWTSLGTSDWSTCFPSGYQPTGYFSPGVCPEGYAPVDQTCISSDEETQATCCPSSNPCTSTVTDTANIHLFFTWQNKVSIETGIYGINAKGISIRWKPDDFPSQTATPTAGNAKSTQSGGSHPNTKSSGLSIGTKAGIGVASALGTTTLLVIFSLVYRRRRKTGLNVIVRSDKPRESDSRPIHEASRGSVYEIYSGIGAYDGIHEMESSGSATNPVEMPTCT